VPAPRVIGFSALLWAALTVAAAAGEPEVGGRLLGELRLGAGEDFAFSDPDFSRRELRLDLFASARPGESLRLYVQGWIRSLGFPETPAAVEDLAAPRFPPGPSFELKEAYADLYGFPLPSLDMRLGRQRIAWGQAEKVGIVDNLNPDDLEDRWDFGRRLASDALRLTWYGSRVTVQGVYIPFFTPARLGADSTLLSDLPPGSSLTFTGLPGADAAAGMSAGLRVSLLLAGWDIAASYVRGRDGIFTVTSTLATGPPPAPLKLTCDYLRRQVLSLDLAGELAGLGVWAEAACFFPEDRELVTDLTAAFGPLSSERTRPYLKLLAGLDRTFPGGLYGNVQLVHGLYSENSRESLEDYLLLGLEWPLAGGRVKLGPLGLALEIDDLRDPGRTWGLIVNPELSVAPADGAALIFGARIIEGREGTNFGRETDAGEIYLRGEFSF
jgi:hypothetical protein